MLGIYLSRHKQFNSILSKVNWLDVTESKFAFLFYFILHFTAIQLEQVTNKVLELYIYVTTSLKAQ